MAKKNDNILLMAVAAGCFLLYMKNSKKQDSSDYSNYPEIPTTPTTTTPAVVVTTPKPTTSVSGNGWDVSFYLSAAVPKGSAIMTAAAADAAAQRFNSLLGLGLFAANVDGLYKELQNVPDKARLSQTAAHFAKITKKGLYTTIFSKLNASQQALVNAIVNTKPNYIKVK